MNTFTKLLFNFIFLYTILYFGLPNIENDNYIQHKLIIFIALFSFNYVLNVITKIRSECTLTQAELASKSINAAVAGLIGYTLYIDFNIMEWSKDYIKSLKTNNYMSILVVTLITIMFMALVKILVLLFEPVTTECDKKII